MDTMTAITRRRSIRAFCADPIPQAALEQILRAGTLAPSGKNRQPWHFVVVGEDKRAEMVRLMRMGIEARKAAGDQIGSAEGTARVMEQAPITVFVFNPEGAHPWEPRDIPHAFGDLINLQSIGAAIQNMLLAATELGIGSLWIGDILFAYMELCSWLAQSTEMVAAISFGYPAAPPGPTSRKSVDEVTTWF